MALQRNSFVDPGIAEYAASRTSEPDDLDVALQKVTSERTGRLSGMQIGADQALLMEMLVRAIGATRAIEVGTFTGFSALAIARGMGPGSRLICCDVSEEWTAVAREHWARAGVADRIDLRVAPAIETLRSLPSGEQFDFAFIDADKVGYADYYQELVPRMRVGSLLLADNTLQTGAVLDASSGDESVAAIRRFNDTVVSDPRVRVALLPFGDGVSFVQKLRS